jgi:hypothetical protein
MFLVTKNHSLVYSTRIAVGLTLSLCLLRSIPAQAEYQPPSEPSAPSSGTSTAGTRGGCSGQAEGGLTVLAPLSYTGQAISTHPTLFWFVADQQSYPLEFQLYQQANGKRQMLHKVKMQSQPGLMRLALDQIELQPGQTYNWRVILSCNLNYPSGDSVAGATIQVVPLSSGLRSQLSTAKTPIDRANLYAQNGFWYDAIAEASQPNLSAKPLQASLVSDLAKSERESPQFAAIIQEQKERLKQIATHNQ